MTRTVKAKRENMETKETVSTTTEPPTLRELHRAFGFTQLELANLIGCSYMTLSRREDKEVSLKHKKAWEMWVAALHLLYTQKGPEDRMRLGFEAKLIMQGGPLGEVKAWAYLLKHTNFEGLDND